MLLDVITMREDFCPHAGIFLMNMVGLKGTRLLNNKSQLKRSTIRSLLSVAFDRSPGNMTLLRLNQLLISKTDSSVNSQSVYCFMNAFTLNARRPFGQWPHIAKRAYNYRPSSMKNSTQLNGKEKGRFQLSCHQKSE